MKSLTKNNNFITDTDKYLFHEGKHISVYNFMGSHKTIENNTEGVRFTTWAPNASKICVIGDFCLWEINKSNYMEKITDNGLWSIFISNVENNSKYKFAITNKDNNFTVFKSDPYSIKGELRPNNASIININTNNYIWNDKKWLKKRKNSNIFKQAMNIYELHLGSWKTKNDKFMTYKEIAEILPKYVKKMGFTHIELMPLHEHPLDASWGYQPTGFFAVNNRHGDSNGLKLLIDNLHKLNIGVILDWVPGHFCKDEHGLINFDGSPTYEYQNYNKATNKGWGTNNFDLGRNEVKSFLISNALYWINEFHIDGLRVDAVSNILYLSYDREEHEWEPNINGGSENLEGVQFLKEFNSIIKKHSKGVITIAEESSSWPNVTKSAKENGLGFDFKWNMGWMNDTLRYIELDPIYRKYQHNLINFSMVYNYTENFILPISHDEVVHGKKSLVNKMHGDLWNKYAGLRLYATYMIGHPGKKLLFMGSEFAQFIEWREYEELQWDIIENFDIHKKIHNFFKKLNHFYKKHSALWEDDYSKNGFQWIDADNNNQSILSFIRKSKKETLIFICNFTPVVYYDYKIGVPKAGSYKEIFNSDKEIFGGSNQLISEKLLSKNEKIHNFKQSISIKVPPLASVILKFKK